MGRKLFWFFLCFLLVVSANSSPVYGQNLSPDEAVPGQILVRYTQIGAKTADDMIAGAPAPSRSAVDFWQSFTNWLGLSDTTPEMEARIARETLEDLAGRFGVTEQASLGRNQKGTRTIKLGAQQVFTNPSARTGVDPLENVYLVSFQTGTIDEFITAMNASGLSVEAQPNYRYQAEAVPNDTDYSSQWSHQRIGSEQAWNTVTGSQTIVVAVLDTGVMYSHPDLSGNMWQGDVGGGQTGYGFDFVSNDPDPNDENGHGTHVAGIIGAKGNNGTGIAGVNWNTRIMAIRVLDASGGGTTAGVSQGIRFAADNGARVMNISLGQVSDCNNPDAVLSTVIADATAKRSLLVVAAGNSHINAACDSPANHPDVLVVGARGPQDETASYSNYGLLAWKNTKIVTAPGGVAAAGSSCTATTCMLSTKQGGGYASAKGTSFAAPVVSGLASLILSARDMDPAALRTHIITSAVDKNDDFTTPINPNIPNDDGTRTYGKLISASAAISNLTALAVTTTPAPSDSRIPVGTTDTLIINIIGQTTITPTPPAGATATPPAGSTLTPTVRPPTATPPAGSTLTPTVRPPTATPGGPTVTPGGPTGSPCQGDSDNDGEGDSDDDDDGKDCDNDSDDRDGDKDDDKDDEKDDEKEVSVKIKVKKNGKVSRLPKNASISPGSLISICFNRAPGKTSITIDTGKGKSIQFSKTYRYAGKDRCLHVRGDKYIRIGALGNNLSSRTIKITVNSGNQTITKTIRVAK